MKQATNILTKVGMGLLSTVALATSALAAVNDFSTSSSSSGDAAAGGVFAIVVICVYVCMCIFFIVYFVFWLRALLDLLKRTDAEMPNKTMWLILLLLVNISWVYYWFVEKKKLGPVQK